MERPYFENIGYFKDYYVGGTYMGSLSAEKDREEMGYAGRKVEILTEDLKLKKGIIKKGTAVVTQLMPLCGKQIK